MSFFLIAKSIAPYQQLPCATSTASSHTQDGWREDTSEKDNCFIDDLDQVMSLLWTCEAQENWYPSMILNGCTMTSPNMAMKPAFCKPTTQKSALTCFSSPPAGLGVASADRFSCGAYKERTLQSLRKLTIVPGFHGVASLHLSAASAPLVNGKLGNLGWKIPSLPRRHAAGPRSPLVPRASKEIPYSWRHPPMTKKPRWWWRTIACLPYVMPLHLTWIYAETAYHLHPFLENLEFLTQPFLGIIASLPSWFLTAYFFAAYLGIVRRKEWPHFFRFHVVMGMLLEIALQVIGTVSQWMPLAVYWGKMGLHFWTAVAFAYLFTVLECMRCALGGMYADIPFVCDAAYIQIPYD